MGQICPICQTHQAQIQCITPDFGPARKAVDVMAVKLACGHIVGGPEVDKYREKTRKLAEARMRKQAELDEEYKKQVAAAWVEVQATKGVSK